MIGQTKSWRWTDLQPSLEKRIHGQDAASLGFRVIEYADSTCTEPSETTALSRKEVVATDSSRDVRTARRGPLPIRAGSDRPNIQHQEGGKGKCQ